MFLVAGIGFFGISNGSFHNSDSLVLGTQVFAGCVYESDGTASGIDCPNGIEKKTQDTDIQKAINQIILFWNIIL